MNADQLASEIIENTKQSLPNLVSIERLSAGEAVAMVPRFMEAFEEHKLWPKNAAAIIAACRPTDDQLLKLLQDDRERFQKLGLHVLALRIEQPEYQGTRHLVVAVQVRYLLQSDTFRPKRKDLRLLQAWAASQCVESDKPPAPL